MVFGPDRAADSFNKSDGLWTQFSFNQEDAYFSALFRGPALADKVPRLENARDLYYSFFRMDSFDPRGLLNPSESEQERAAAYAPYFKILEQSRPPVTQYLDLSYLFISRKTQPVGLSYPRIPCPT